MFTLTIPVRYADIDAQGHVNNVTYFTYFEQARVEYFIATGLWQPSHDFGGQGTIVAEATCTYKRPILLNQRVQIQLRVSHIGTKSFTMEYVVLANDEVAATGRTVQVAYDYTAQRSIAVPETWREAMHRLDTA